VDANHVAQKVPLELSKRIFSTNLIILSGQGIDVIQGMSWMKLHRAVLDIAGPLVHLESLMYSKVILNLPAVSRIKASIHHVVELSLRIFMSSESFQTCSLMIYLGCHLKGRSSSKLSYNLVLLL
jgi:hypothetical protein